MRIGIDISQIVYEGTGVARYVRELVGELTKRDTKNEYILFGASLRLRHVFGSFVNTLNPKAQITLKTYPLPPTILNVLWNVWHIIPVEWLIGAVDIFWSSDWTQPPLARARGITTIHDVIALRFPEETHNTTEIDHTNLRISANIAAIHARRFRWVEKECAVILCDSEATKRDCMELLGIDGSRIEVVYPGFRL